MIKLNDKELHFKQFGNKETEIDGEEILSCVKKGNDVYFKYEDDSDLIKLMFLKRHLDKCSYTCSLTIAYMPYSRMDRVEGLSVFTLKYVCEFINSLKFNRVFVYEAHSDVTAALLDNCKVIDQSLRLLSDVKKRIDFDDELDFMFYPDAGAAKRYSKLGNKNELVAFKKRNFETHRIESLQVIGEIIPGRKVIIVDDLSSYGGTFMLSAEKLKEMGAGDIYLVVTHCEDSIFKGKIPDSCLIKKVYTTDSIISESIHEKVEIIHELHDRSYKLITPKTTI